MKENLTQILMNEAIREGWREWMAKVRTVLPQTDAERPVTWIAAERLARDHGRMVRCNLQIFLCLFLEKLNMPQNTPVTKVS